MSVSVVIPTWNRAATLGRAIVSAACQNSVEVVVIDDASTDDTPGIVEQLQKIYPCVRYVRHEEKSHDWQEAAAAVYPLLMGSHVVCMGADDWLCMGLVQSINAHPDAAVVFHDYAVEVNGILSGAVLNGYSQTTKLTPDEMCRRLLHHPNATETGIASGIRRDCLAWLVSQHLWLMGPWSDAIGYAAVAAKWGCVFVPGIGGTFNEDPVGYGETQRNSPGSLDYRQACREFIRRAGVPEDVAAAICRKRGVS